jgi:prepilin-type N-terminal cleavage/methylation domain-containing protein
MPEMTASSMRLRKNRLASFTLIELLTVMTIISILAALVIFAASGAWSRAKRSRAAGEIQGMSTALESYKTDNGIYPVGNTTAGTASALTGPPGGTYPLDPSLVGGKYQISSEALYQALSGQAYYTATPVAGVKSYMPFKINQIGNPAGPLSYVKDPWNYSYGYSTGSPSSPPTVNDLAPYNSAGFFDLWSTGGTTGPTTANPNAINAWISNWQ